VAALQMRRCLRDYGRARNGPERRRDLAVPVPDELLAATEAPGANLIIHDLLDRLERKDPKAAEVVELKFYAGRNYEEIAASLGISVATVRRRWAAGMTWLARNGAASGSAGPEARDL
jgi:RNA polymerase sigma factor (sigma-70 family)